MTRHRFVLGSAQWGMPYGIANANGPPDDAELRTLYDYDAATVDV